MAKKCALFDNRVIQSGEISIAITKQFFKKKKDKNLYSTPSDEYFNLMWTVRLM